MLYRYMYDTNHGPDNRFFYAHFIRDHRLCISCNWFCLCIIYRLRHLHKTTLPDDVYHERRMANYSMVPWSASIMVILAYRTPEYEDPKRESNSGNGSFVKITFFESSYYNNNNNNRR